MKDFFKNVFATVVGIILTGIITFLLLLFIIGIAVGMGDSSYQMKDNSVLTLHLDGVLQERAPEATPFDKFLHSGQPATVGLNDMLKAIAAAKDNDKIRGIYLEAGAFEASPASVMEIRKALLDFKKSNKFIFAYGDNYSQCCYYLASTADEIAINPQGTVDIHGLSAGSVFFKSLLQKIGVEMQIFRVGNYKSAVEPFTSDKMSEASREQSLSFVSDIWNEMVKNISASRHIDADRLKTMADSITAFKPVEYYLENALIDTVIYHSQVNDYLKKRMDLPQDHKIHLVSATEAVSAEQSRQKVSDNKIAILYAQGDIVSGDEYSTAMDEITDRKMVRELKALQEDSSVKAVVFRINSGGGSGFASEQIWKAVSELRTVKPIVVSMSDYAASGGYYIACAASKIVAQESTLTGSIGVFGIMPNAEGLFNKIGISIDQVGTSKYADMGNVSRPMMEYEKQALQNYTENYYNIFVGRCAKGRNMTPAQIDSIGQGRVWTGKQALTLGLVDKIGGLNDAVKIAAQLAKIDEYSIMETPTVPTFMEELFGLSAPDEAMVDRALQEWFGSDYALVKQMRNLKQRDCIQALMPWQIQTR